MASSPMVVLLLQQAGDDREMYVEFLRFKGLLPVPVSTPAEALPIAPRADVIVTAISLTGSMDGPEFIAQLKRDERTKRVPVIVLTACAQQSARDRAIAAGCDAFLAKPCLPDTLLSEIRRLVALRRVPAPQPASATTPPTTRVRRTN